MYQVLYRKWRPQTFDDVYGQPHVTGALSSEVRSGSVAHAYLFTGSRGTGKTTCARILSKAVNCLNPQNGNPCNECDNCRGIDSGSVMDVVEIDAASNTGVDNIRDLREEAAYTPVTARYRVYIIDEVHMLSGGAFNALLKTLEEPPEHAIFILATTEIQKIPATILSRCQRFDFHRISADDIAARLRFVAEQEQVTLTEDAAMMIARLADGALRDALSLLDRCLSGGRSIDAETVAEAAGLAGRDHLFALSAAVHSGNAGEALVLLDKLYASACDMGRLCTEWMEFYRQLMLLKSAPDAAPHMLVVTPAELARLTEQAKDYGLPLLLHAIDVLRRSGDRLRTGVSPRVEMEMAILKLCDPALDADLTALLRRVQRLEDVGGRPAPAASVAPTVPVTPAAPTAPKAPVTPVVPAAPVQPEPPAEPVTAPAPTPPTIPTPTAVETPLSVETWEAVMRCVAEKSPPLAGVLTGSSAVVRGDMVLVATDNEMFKVLAGRDGNRAVLVDSLREVTGQTYRIGVKKTAAPAASADPLSDFLRRSRDLGVTVEEN